MCFVLGYPPILYDTVEGMQSSSRKLKFIIKNSNLCSPNFNISRKCVSNSSQLMSSKSSLYFTRSWHWWPWKWWCAVGRRTNEHTDILQRQLCFSSTPPDVALRDRKCHCDASNNEWAVHDLFGIKLSSMEARRAEAGLLRFTFYRVVASYSSTADPKSYLFRQ